MPLERIAAVISAPTKAEMEGMRYTFTSSGRVKPAVFAGISSPKRQSAANGAAERQRTPRPDVYKRQVNVDLWERLLKLLEEHDVTFHWVKGHAQNPMNNRCDALAVAQSRSFGGRQQ